MVKLLYFKFIDVNVNHNNNIDNIQKKSIAEFTTPKGIDLNYPPKEIRKLNLYLATHPFTHNEGEK